MKKLLAFLSLLIPTAAAAHPDPLATLLRLPQAKELWETIAPVEIRFEHFGADASHAMWLGDRRHIVLNASVNPTFGTMLSSILFEMHNAHSHEQFLALDHVSRHGEITCEEYVVSCEWIEFQNAHQTADLLRQGISQGIFPPEAYLDVESDFGSFFQTQEDLGHTAQMRQIFYHLRS